MVKKTEIEIKLRVPDPAAIPPLLRKIGATEIHPREFEDNQLYDFPNFSLKMNQSMLRVRHQERESTLTYKEAPRVEGGAKVRDEMEVTVSSSETMIAILSHLGMRPLFRYQKYRAAYQYSGLMITLDETPIGVFLELEGPKHLIDEVAARLGYKMTDYISKSYLSLYQEHLKSRGLPLKDMLFETP